ncbi:MAG: tetrahydromethanopterin S-methyltransferase subunit A [Thermoproteota archaeon]|nr:tetrahydromethanopterin S-methyltransferase subunit A [Thermoproteota archaeon]
MAGKICETLIPIKHEYYMGKRGKEIAICTLSSIQLLEDICKSSEIMDKILIVGRLLSENKGIDAIIKFTLTHPELHYLVICGKEVRGHKAGQALLSLYENGINNNNTNSRTIIGAKGPYPVLTSSYEDIVAFRKQIRRIYDLIGIDDIEQIKRQLISN